MLATTLILAALTLLLAVDDTASHDDRGLIPIETEDHDTLSR